MDLVNLTCIGGGHGLGHLLSVVNTFEHCHLTGIVCTTDNGGSTGRLREHSEGIAWGDIRYCLSKLSESSSIKSLLFEYRFDNAGDLSGHSLGNLMCSAVDSLCLRPTDSVKVMREFLGIQADILPMSDQATHLVGYLNCGEELVGELAVDNKAQLGIEHLALRPAVNASEEVLAAIAKTDVLLLGPGSFYTSVVPSLLVAGVVEAINANSNIRLYFIANVAPEFEIAQGELDNQMQFFEALGIGHKVIFLIPEQRMAEVSTTTQKMHGKVQPVSVSSDSLGRHNASELKQLLAPLLQAL
ncbi:gluconeogenesis factor YvcK family protein [Thalassotalea montiporae]